MSLKEWPVPSTRTWRARATTVCSSPTEAGRYSSGAPNVMLPAQLVRGLAVVVTGDRTRLTAAGRRTTAR